MGQVIVGGGALPAVRVDVNPTALNQHGLSLEDVRAALACSVIAQSRPAAASARCTRAAAADRGFAESPLTGGTPSPAARVSRRGR